MYAYLKHWSNIDVRVFRTQPPRDLVYFCNLLCCVYPGTSFALSCILLLGYDVRRIHVTAVCFICFMYIHFFGFCQMLMVGLVPFEYPH